MGTRSLTFVYDDNSPVICMYRQFDGYPSGHGMELAEFLNSFEAITNGIRVGETRKTANGMGCLAAQLVAHFKTDSNNGEESKSIKGKNPMIVGGFYLYPTNSKDCGQEYEYHIYSDRITVKDYDGNAIYTGPWQYFKEFCLKEE